MSVVETNGFGRSNLKEFLIANFDIKLSEIQAIEGIHFCRGTLMEKSPTFSHDKLIQWLHAHIPIYQSAQQITDKVSTQQNKATFTKKDDVNDKQTEKML